MLWICVCIIVGIIGLIILGIAPLLKSDFFDLMSRIFITAAATIAVVILFFFIVSRASIDTVVEEKYQEYKMYSTLYELDAFKDEPLAEMLLYQDILEYNRTIERAHEAMNGNWCNIFYPKKHWANIPLIDVKRIE